VTINHEQKSVPRTLLDELDADLKWGSSVPAERLASVAARIVGAMTETVGEALFRRVIAQGMQGDDVMCLTMPEIKGGLVRSHLIGSLAQKRKQLVSGPLSSDSDERTVKKATQAINLFFRHLRAANLQRWDLGRKGGFCTNAGCRAMLLLFHALIRHAEKRNGFDAAKVKTERLVDEVMEVAKPLTQFLSSVPDDEFLERFTKKYGSGGPPEYFYEMSQVIWEQDKKFTPEGLEEHINSKDEQRVRGAQDTIQYLESRITDIVINYFKKLHGEKYWNFLGTKEMRVKA
jgi:DNA sulfur modification protein DndB